jgi:hypothetical protein
VDAGGNANARHHGVRGEVRFEGSVVHLTKHTNSRGAGLWGSGLAGPYKFHVRCYCLALCVLPVASSTGQDRTGQDRIRMATHWSRGGWLSFDLHTVCDLL